MEWNLLILILVVAIRKNLSAYIPMQYYIKILKIQIFLFFIVNMNNSFFNLKRVIYNGYVQKFIRLLYICLFKKLRMFNKRIRIKELLEA